MSQDLDDRYRTGNASLVQKTAASLLCQAVKLFAPLRDHMFVRCHDVFAGAQRPFHERPRGFQAAHGLNDDVDLPVVNDRVEVAGE